MYIYNIYICICIYIYVYIYRERYRYRYIDIDRYRYDRYDSQIVHQNLCFNYLSILYNNSFYNQGFQLALFAIVYLYRKKDRHI